MFVHCMEIGDGRANVECRFDFDAEGDIEVLEVYVDGEGKDIKDALTEAVVIDIEAECNKAAEREYNERKYDTAIDNYIERMAA